MFFRTSTVGVVYALAIGTGLPVAYQLGIYGRDLAARLLPTRALVRDSLSLGLKGYLGNLLQWANYRFDVFVVSFFLGTREVGLYAVAYSVVELLWYLPQALASVLLPTTAWSSSDNATLRTQRICRLSLASAAFGALVVGTASPWLLHRLLGQDFDRAAVFIYLLLPGALVFVAAKILAADLCGRGLPEFATYAAGFGFVLTCASNLLFVPTYGVAAAAVISSVIYTAEALYLIVKWCELTGSRVRELLIPHAADLPVLLGVLPRAKKIVEESIRAIPLRRAKTL